MYHVHSSTIKVARSPTLAVLRLPPDGRPAELTCTVSMTIEKEWSWQSRASWYWQTPLKVKYLSSKLLKWDCPVMRHSPAGTQEGESVGGGGKSPGVAKMEACRSFAPHPMPQLVCEIYRKI